MHTQPRSLLEIDLAPRPTASERYLEERQCEIAREAAQEFAQIKKVVRAGLLIAVTALGASRIANKTATPSLDAHGTPATPAVTAPAPQKQAAPVLRAAAPARPQAARETRHDARPEWAVKLGVDAETIATADSAITAALRSHDVRTHAPELARDHDLLTAVAIKESALNGRAQSEARARGMFQLTPIAAEELARRTGRAFTAKDLMHPETNAIAGILYFDRSLEQATKLFPAEGDPAKRRKLALIDYNAGTGVLRALVRDGDTYDTFIARLAQQLNTKLHGGIDETIRMVHPSYGVAFDLRPGVLAHLDRRARGSYPRGSIGGYSIMRVGDALLYCEVIPAIAAHLHDAPPAWINDPAPVTLTAEKGIWSVSDEVLNHLVGRTNLVTRKNVTNFKDRARLRDAVTRAIIAYNNAENGDFAKLRIVSNPGADIPPGTEVLIPDLRAFEGLLAEQQLGKRSARKSRV